MPRRARLDAPGTLHHVMIRGIERRRIVDDDEDRLLFVERLGELSQKVQTAVYAWALMGRVQHSLQDCSYVLKWFGEQLRQSRQDYRRFVEMGVALGRQPQLVGGGLVRSAGG
jgi:hypothetical protein